MNEPPAISSRRASHGWKFLSLLLIVAAIALLFFRYREQVTLETLVKREAALTAFTSEHFGLSLLAAVLIYIAVTGSSLPVATGMSLVCGKLFGFWPALLVVSFGSTAGAIIAFTLSRYLLRDAVQSRFSGRLAAINSALERDGAFYLFSLRLIPQVPFVVINVVMGLSPIRLATFWWVSQLGMLPVSGIWVYAGYSLPSLAHLQQAGLEGIVRPQLLAALMVMGLFPLFAKWLVARMRKAASDG